MKNIKGIITVLLLLVCFFPTIAQQTNVERIEIKGTVKDDMGEPLIGVSIIAKNQPGFGTTTNLDGQFSFKTRPQDVLVISYMGYKTVEIPILAIKDTRNYLLIMEEDNQKIDEIVVTAAGKQKKVTVLGAFTTVDVKHLNTPGPNLANSLAGVVPGIIAMQSSGEPGEDMSEFWIRGISTFGARQGALILVDGVERSFNEIPVEDIESFSVLKDASATAIYGIRGANGVVLVTTKRGERGKLKISGNFSYGVNALTKSPDYVDAYTYASMANEAKQARYLSPLYTDEELLIIKNGLDRDLYPNINWRDLVLKKSAPTYRATLNFSGGGDNATYYVSLGYISQDGIYKTHSAENKYNTNISYDRYNFRTNVNIDLTRTTVLKVSLGGYLINRTSPHIESKEIFKTFARYTPLSYPRKYSSGEWAGSTPEMLMTQTGYRNIWENKVETSITLEQDLEFLLKGLTFSGTFAFDTWNKNTIRRIKRPEIWKAQDYRDEYGELILRRDGNEQLMTQQSETIGDRRYFLQAHLDYSRLFAEKHRFGAFAMFYQEEKADTNHSDDIIKSVPKRNLAYSGRFTYGFLDRYLVEMNWGYTGSENFERGKRFGFFPAYAAGWVISEEPFVKQIAPWMDMLKVRASYGRAGNDVIASKRFPYITLLTQMDPENKSSGHYSFGEFGSNFINGYRILQVGTPNLTWEVAKKYNLGIDYSFFNGKISGAVDFFKDIRDEIFMVREYMPLVTGLADRKPMANVGHMRNTGFDGNIEFNQQIDKVHFTLRANMTYQNNEILDHDEAANELWYKMKKGFRMDQTRGYIALGLFENEEDIASSPTQKFGGVAVMPGDIKYKDVNGDGVIDDKDQVPLGYRTVPGMVYGFGFSASWNNFDLSVLFQGSGKRDFFVHGDGVFPFASGDRGNIMDFVAAGERWIPKEISKDPTTENPNAAWPRLTYGGNANNSQNSTFWLKDGSYLRLRNVEFSYSVPREVIRKFYLTRLQIGFIGRNLCTWSSFKWWDPEPGSSNGSYYPIEKTYSMFARISF